MVRVPEYFKIRTSEKAKKIIVYGMLSSLFEDLSQILRETQRFCDPNLQKAKGTIGPYLITVVADEKIIIRDKVMSTPVIPANVCTNSIMGF